MQLNKLRSILSKKDKVTILVLIGMSILLSLIETIGITAVMPFISVASNPELIIENEYFNKIYIFLNFSNTTEFIIAFGIILIFFYILRAMYTIFYTYTLLKFSFGKYNRFAYELLQKYTSMPYKEFVNKNSFTLTKTIVTEAFNLTSYTQSFLTLFSEIFTIVLLYSMLLIVNYKMTLVLTLVLGIKILFLTKTITKKITKQGIKRNEFQNSFYNILGQTFGNLKFIKLKCNENQILKEFEKASKGFSNTNIVSNTLQVLPRIVLETLGFGILISIVLYVLISTNDVTAIIPIISMYALALYRILPALNRILSSYNQMMYLSKSLDIVYEDLGYKIEDEGNIDIKFNNKIEAKNIYFSYNNKQNVLENINITIKKGEKIAFIGASGKGKSTLIDILIGIHKPISGELKIDGESINNTNIRSWRQKIGYIPQSIYLFDDSVAENISFGDDMIEDKVIEVLKKVNMYDFLQKKFDGIYTHVGEGGIKLSGGQKQRIGIARALYNNPDILVLDEATSALDNETEAKIMEEIYNIGKEKTLLIIAHRLSTIQGCQRIIDLDKLEEI